MSTGFRFAQQSPGTQQYNRGSTGTRPVITCCRRVRTLLTIQVNSAQLKTEYVFTLKSGTTQFMKSIKRGVAVEKNIKTAEVSS